jgi:Fungal specific transcription factor domain
VRNLEAEIKALKTEVEELRSHQNHYGYSSTFENTQLPADIPQEFPSDEIRPAFSLEKYSPSALSNYNVFMQDPFEIAKMAIDNVLSIEDQGFLRSLYFSNCHPFVPIIHEPTFDTKAGDAHVVLSVFALACRHSTNFNTKAELLYSLAKQTTQATFMNPDMSSLVALLLQAVYEIGRPNTSVHSVTTVGAALALASSFRLLWMDEEHGDKQNHWLEKSKDWVEEEGRRRAFLMVLSISRWSATIQQRELGFPVKNEISVLLPVSDEIWFAGVRFQSSLLLSRTLSVHWPNALFCFMPI